MPRKYLRITEVTKICGVDVKFVKHLEQEKVIYPIVRHSEKFYSLDQVDRVRVARLLIEDMGVTKGFSRAKHARANDRHAAPV
jgi:DNA-binding transcriptional MerR regulator